MKLNNRFIFGILSLLLAAVIAFVALPTIARQTNGKEEIVRITQPVLKGEQISSEYAEVVEVGGYNLPSNIAHLLSDVMVFTLPPTWLWVTISLPARSALYRFRPMWRSTASLPVRLLSR